MKKYNKAKTKKKIYILSIILLGLVAVLGAIIFSQKNKETITFGGNETAEEDEAIMEAVEIDLGDGLIITKIGSYTGKYMEDASDEAVSDVMSIMLTNKSDATLQYAEITLSGKVGDAVFSVTTLNSGASMLILEASRKEFDDSYKDASIQNVVFFEEDLNLYEDTFEIQPLDGGFNITNISKKDINDEIIIYFKDCINGIYYGGITYRGRIEGGLKSGEIRQIMTDNFSESDTEVMFITIAGK